MALRSAASTWFVSADTQATFSPVVLPRSRELQTNDLTVPNAHRLPLGFLDVTECIATGGEQQPPLADPERDVIGTPTWISVDQHVAWLGSLDPSAGLFLLPRVPRNQTSQLPIG